jgi:hypothetical protein
MSLLFALQIAFIDALLGSVIEALGSVTFLIFTDASSFHVGGQQPKNNPSHRGGIAEVNQTDSCRE